MSRKKNVPCARAAPLRSAKATIGAIITSVPDGKQPFVVSYLLPESTSHAVERGASITFSLCNWSEGAENPPRFGQVVLLEKINRFARGWRASYARPLELEVVES